MTAHPMDNKICIVTGANAGIGKATTEGLAKAGATVVMMCRQTDTGQAALDDIQKKTGSDKLHLIQVNLASFDEIRAAAKTFLDRFDRLDVLINNAAVVPSKRELTQDGIEKQFGVNHLAPFLLTLLLIDRLKQSTPSRIVNVSSTLHHSATIDFDDLQAERSYGALRVYGQSKLANVLFTYELARRLEGTGVTVNAVHPGGVRTQLGRHAPIWLKPLLLLASALMIGPEKGAKTSLYVATAPELEDTTGKYFAKSRVAPSSKESHDEAVAKRLWEISAELTGVDYPSGEAKPL